MELTVVIISYNVRYFLELCLQSVSAATKHIGAEVIVIDNNSADDSCIMVKTQFPEVILIENSINLGFSKANNIGVRQAGGKYVCILNPDTVVAEDTFTKLLHFAKTQNNMGIVGCRLIDGSGKYLPESKRNIPTAAVALFKMVGLTRLLANLKLCAGYYNQNISDNETGDADILVGAFMMIEKQLYDNLGGFDEDYFMYGEDIDISYRALKSGYKNMYFGGTTIIHFKGESTYKNSTYTKHFHRAMVLFYQKHYGSSRVLYNILKLGSYLFSIVKTFTDSRAKIINPKQYILISTTRALVESLSTRLKSEVVFVNNIHRKDINISSKKPKNRIATEIIIDNNNIGFKEIIEIMEEMTGRNITYKILPTNCKYIIGSNNSRVQGEVIGDVI